MDIQNFPVAILVISFVGFWLAVVAGIHFGTRVRPLEEAERDQFVIVLTATLTLLGLLIGFTFDMAVSRYDLRKHDEEDEANAIGTEYLRADLMLPSDTPKVRELLKKYLDQRISFYTISGIQPGSEPRLKELASQTAEIQAQMWSLVQNSANAKATPTVALATSGMNDVLNSQGYTQAAWWNRVPASAWLLMGAIAFCCCLLMGFGARCDRRFIKLVLPIVLSIAFFLIADIDSPRNGIIRIRPDNLRSLAQNLSRQ